MSKCHVSRTVAPVNSQQHPEGIDWAAPCYLSPPAPSTAVRPGFTPPLQRSFISRWPFPWKARSQADRVPAPGKCLHGGYTSCLIPARDRRGSTADWTKNVLPRRILFYPFKLQCKWGCGAILNYNSPTKIDAVSKHHIKTAVSLNGKV